MGGMEPIEKEKEGALALIENEGGLTDLLLRAADSWTIWTNRIVNEE